MVKMGITAVYPRPRTSKPHPQHRVYPCLLRNLTIDHPGQVWCADVTYIPMRRGFMYLVAIMDWHSRRVLSFRLSNTLDTDFCVEALQEALLRYDAPEIFNSDQGAQFTSQAFTSVLEDHGIQISMDGRGRYLDNIFIERLWVEADGSEEMDLFITLMRLDENGGFLPTNVMGQPHPGQSGKVRVSQRALDPVLSTDFQPVQSHRASQRLKRGEIVPVDIAIYPFSRI
jgi:transposase InsO family protein